MDVVAPMDLNTLLRYRIIPKIEIFIVNLSDIEIF